jgi:tartrate-resistant acid phosphatase type 5
VLGSLGVPSFDPPYRRPWRRPRAKGIRDALALALPLAAVMLGSCRRPGEYPATAQGLSANETPGAPLGPSPVSPSDAAPSGSPDAGWPVGFRFAVIGDYGVGSVGEQRVAALVKTFKPEVVITLGDNNYQLGGADTIDANIGQFYAEFIGAYHGRFGPGASENRFFPALGNHDWYTKGAKPYLDYFTLPGNERYYTFSRGPIDFFALDSAPNEPDGNAPHSKQARWFKAAAAQAKGAWQIAYMHHPPHSSGPHGSSPEAAWPYAEAGIDLVLAGHDHVYERAVVGGLTFLVNGLGGAPLYSFARPTAGSLFRYQAQHGAQLGVATADELRLTFVNVDGVRIDEVVLRHGR